MRQLPEKPERCKGLNHKKKKGSSGFFMSIYWFFNRKHPYLQVFIHYEDQNQCV